MNIQLYYAFPSVHFSLHGYRVANGRIEVRNTRGTSYFEGMRSPSDSVEVKI